MILVVGGEGLLGGAVLRALRSAGHEAAGTSVRDKPGFIPLDLAAPFATEPPSATRLAVFCAGIGGLEACDRDPLGTAAVNVEGTVALAKRLADRGIPVVYLSSNYATLLCEYGLQKAAVEAALRGPRFAAVRIPKVLESLRPRVLEWARSLQAGREIHASPVLRFAPVALDEAAACIASLAADFRPGLFEAAPDASFSYHEAAVRLARALKRPADWVRRDETGGLPLFRGLLPSFETAAASSFWQFSPASQTLDHFLAAIADEAVGR